MKRCPICGAANFICGPGAPGPSVIVEEEAEMKTRPKPPAKAPAKKRAAPVKKRPVAANKKRQTAATK